MGGASANRFVTGDARECSVAYTSCRWHIHRALSWRGRCPDTGFMSAQQSKRIAASEGELSARPFQRVQDTDGEVYGLHEERGLDACFLQRGDENVRSTPHPFPPRDCPCGHPFAEEQRSLQSSTASRCFPLCHLLCHRDPLEYSHPCCLLSRNSWSLQSRYLQCRMNKGLMTPEDMSKFGLNDQVHRPSSLCNPALDVAAFKFVFYFLTCMHFSMCRSILRLV